MIARVQCCYINLVNVSFFDMFKIHYENFPRLLIPLFLAGSVAFALISSFDMNFSISVIIGLFVVVQLQKNEIV